MLTKPIDNVLLENLGKNGFHRLQKALSRTKLDKLKHFLGKSKDFYREHHLLSLKNVIDFTKGKKRKTGEDDLVHHINVATEGLTKKNYYNLDDALIFNIKLDHDYVENEIEEIVQTDNGFKVRVNDLNLCYDGLEKGQDFSVAVEQQETGFKREIVGTREDLFITYANEHSQIIDESMKKETRDEFNKKLVEGVRTLTRYAGSDDNYEQYIRRIYPSETNSVLIYVPPAKWADVNHNQKTLWSKKIIRNHKLTLEELAEKEIFLNKLFEENESEYYKEKEKYAEKFNILLEEENFNSEWRIKNIEKAILHIYMGKQFLKTQRNDPLYIEYMKPVFEKLVHNAYAQAARERMFQAVYNPEITIPIKKEIESNWIKYAPKGLDQVELEYSKKDDSFKGTISKVITEMMKGEMLSRFFDKKSNKLPSKELYKRTLVYESTLQQNLKGVDLGKSIIIKSISELWDMRNLKFYKTNVKKAIRMNYVLKHFSDLIEYTKSNST